MLAFYRNNKLLVSLFVATLFVIFIGTISIIYFNRHAQQTVLVNEQVHHITMIATQAELQLQNTLANNSDGAIADVIPAVSTTRVAAVMTSELVIGSADWCETRMVKPADEWTLEDQQTFAKHCI